MGLLEDVLGLGSGRRDIFDVLRDAIMVAGSGLSSLLDTLLGFLSSPSGATTAAAVVAAAATHRWWKYALFGLFARIRGSRVLDQPTRARVYELIEARPGIRAQHIVESLGLGVGQAMHHLRTLEREGFLTRTRGPLAKRYFVKGSLPPAAMAAASAEQNPTMAKIQSLVQSRPGATISEAAESLGISAGRVSRIAGIMDEAGLVDKVRAGRAVRLFPKS